MTVQILSVLTIYVLVLVTPGPNFAMVLDLSSQGAKAASYMTGIGFAFGAITLAILSVAGLLSLMAHLPAAKIVLGLAASAYLIWRGVAALRAPTAAQPIRDAPATGRRWSHRPLGAMAAGYLFNVANPKALAFFVGVFGVQMSGLDLAVLGWVLLGCLLLEIGWYSALTWTLHSAPSQRVLTRVRAWMNRATGAVLILFGLGNIAYLARSA